MTDATRLGEYLRRLAANSSIRRVRRREIAHLDRYGLELDQRFHDHVEVIGERVQQDHV